MAASPRTLVDGIEIVDYRKLRIERLLGQGAFGQVHVAHCSHPKVTNPVVIKRMNQPVDDKVRKLFMKEAKLLSQLHHENVIRMYGICEGPLVIILEYVFFDFKPFLNRKIEVNSVDKFLSEISKLPTLVAERLNDLIPTIASDITRGLSYLHNLEIAHRDLKPLNVLISNQHYCDLEDTQEVERLKSVRPVICKLADFGESRSQMVQTNRINDPSTNQGWRGTIPFMAPEILLPEGLDRERKLSLDDLKKVDIWALGLVFYCLVNPSVSFPYEREASNLQDLMMLHRQRRHPSADPSCQPKHATVWSRSRVHDAFQFCTKHNPTERPSASRVLVVLHAHHPASRHTADGVHPKRQKSPERSRLLGTPARTPAIQWYAGEEGAAELKYVFDELTQIADGEVNMSRHTITKDVTMSFMYHRQEWEVKFPCNFPGSKASLTTDGEERGKIGGETVEFAVRSMISLLISSLAQPSPHGRGTPALKGQWYDGEEGEADLKYVFDELTRIADGEVKMSRKKDKQDVTLTFERQGQIWQVKFPSNFPRSRATLISNGEEFGLVGGNTIQTAISAITYRILGQWYATDEGEAALKYVFDELMKLADDDGVQMSRNTDTQDITLSLEHHGQHWQVQFPPDFPRSNAKLTFKGDVYANVGGDDLETAVSAIKNRILSVDNPAAKTLFWKAASCATN